MQCHCGKAANHEDACYTKKERNERRKRMKQRVDAFAERLHGSGQVRRYKTTHAAYDPNTGIINMEVIMPDTRSELLKPDVVLFEDTDLFPGFTKRGWIEGFSDAAREALHNDELTFVYRDTRHTTEEARKFINRLIDEEVESKMARMYPGFKSRYE